MQTIAVTGANGFVGRVLVGWLVERGLKVRAFVRKIDDRCAALAPADVVEIGDMQQVADWVPLLQGVDAVVHLAARVHRMKERDATLYRSENVDATERLAIGARAAHVPHFVFMSSIKVNGERTTDRPFTAADAPRPVDPYGLSKLQAEQQLIGLSDTAMRVTVIRPPLVYGPGVGANFYRLMRVVGSGMPLPFGWVNNSRSLISAWNLADVIFAALTRPGPTAQTLLAADDVAPSTPELIRAIADAMDRRVMLLRVPSSLLRSLAVVAGMQGELSRLTDSLVVDATKTRDSLGWTPPLSLQEGIGRTVRWYLTQRSSRAS